MNKIDDGIKKKIKQFPIAVLLSFVFIGFGALCFYLYVIVNSIDRDGYLVGAIVSLSIGVFSLISIIKDYIKLVNKSKQMDSAVASGNIIQAKIIDEKYTFLEGCQLICSAEVNGTPCEFISSTVPRYSLYACKELGIEELPVYVNMQNPKEYAVDAREVEDRIVDLT